MIKRLKAFAKRVPQHGAFEIFRYIGPALLVTVGFIDPGNWAANMAAGSMFGYSLLWMVVLSTVMLIVLQHNAAHLGIVTGLCISEAATRYFNIWISRGLIISAVLASVATALAELLGSAIGLQMLTGLPLPVGAVLTTALVLYMLLSNSYRRLERWIIGFVSIIGLSFLLELHLSNVDWITTARGCFIPSIPEGAMPIVMSVLGAVVMPHNLFLHSEIIQSRHWNLEDRRVMKRQLKYEFTDTLLAMIIGWAINSAMIIVAAAVFYLNGRQITELAQAQDTLRPLLGSSAAIVFGVALICAGVASAITAGLAGGSIFSGIFGEPFEINKKHTKVGICLTLLGGLAAIFFISNPFQGLIWSQIALSIQLPFTIIALIFLTSSKRVMGVYRDRWWVQAIHWTIGTIVIVLNVMLLLKVF